jgi:predicted dehydrogenase
MKKNYTIGIIGYGAFGKFLHHWWDKLDGVTVVAIFGGSLENGHFGDVKEYERWEDLINNDEIDIVSIATPPAFHVEMACAAMRSNKHVLLEKPVALTAKGVEQILQTQRETGMAITVDHMLRYNPIVTSLMQFSAEGTFGKLRHAVVSNYAQDESLPPEHWFWDKSLSGGIFIEHAVHFFDIINALTTQRFVKVDGAAHNRNGQQQDQVSALVLYDEGLIASHYHSFSGPGFFEKTTIRLTYDLAKIEVEGWMPMKGTITALIKEADRDRLGIIPGFSAESVRPLADLQDVSRPEGWGSTSSEATGAIRCGGITYAVDEMVEGSFGIRQTKSEVYGLCLQEIISDLIKKIEDPGHKLRITVDNAYEGLKIALLADQSAKGNGSSLPPQ